MNTDNIKTIIKSSRAYAIILSSFFTIISLIVIIIGYNIVRFTEKDYNKTTNGIVLSSMCLNVKKTLRNVDFDKTMCEISVMYVVNDKKYIKKFLLNQSINVPINEKIKIAYKESDPEQSKVKYIFNPAFGTGSILSGLFTIFSCWSIVMILFFSKKLNQI